MLLVSLQMRGSVAGNYISVLFGDVMVHNGIFWTIGKKLYIGKLVVYCYVDADFARLFFARSRNGFVVTFSNFPLLWVSKLQTEIALSTLHSEYVELSHSVRALLPLKSLIKEVIENLGIDCENLKFVSSSTVYEDNNGAIVVATSTGMTPSSKHIAVKHHWFRQHVGKEFLIRNIESENQKSDLFTKGLQGQIFVRIRKLPIRGTRA